MIKVNDDIIINQDRFPDGTLHLDVSNIININKLDKTTITWNYENDSELFALICLKKHLDNWGLININLELPYLPNARMDRVKSDLDVFTLKYFCEIINSLDFAKVIVWDAHSNVALALLDRVVNNECIFKIQKAIGYTEIQNLTLFFPDEGAMKRYSDHFRQIPYAFGIKKRDWATGRIEGLNIQNKELIEGKDILIVDDICSRGGTFLYSAKALKEAGANKIYLYITHLEKTVLEGELWKEMVDNQLIECIFTPDPLGKFDERYVIKL